MGSSDNAKNSVQVELVCDATAHKRAVHCKLYIAAATAFIMLLVAMYCVDAHAGMHAQIMGKVT